MGSLNTYSDTELLHLMKANNQAAYTEIYSRYTPVLYRHAYSKLQNREEARDLIQELFTTFWHKRHVIAVETNLSGYLYASLRNKVINIFHHKQIQTTYFSTLHGGMEQFESPTDHRLRENELAELIEKEVAGLPLKMREVFEMSRKKNLSRKQIAAELNLSEKTVKNQINNALKILKIKMERMLTFF